MAKQHEVQADWREVSPDTLPDDIRRLYDDYKEAQRYAASQREAFETRMASVAALPSGSRLAFGYRFGKLSIAVIPDDKPTRQATKAPASLADFLAAQRLTGSRS